MGNKYKLWPNFPQNMVKWIKIKYWFWYTKYCPDFLHHFRPMFMILWFRIEMDELAHSVFGGLLILIIKTLINFIKLLSRTNWFFFKKKKQLCQPDSINMAFYSIQKSVMIYYENKHVDKNNQQLLFNIRVCSPSPSLSPNQDFWVVVVGLVQNFKWLCICCYYLANQLWQMLLHTY